MKYLQSFLLVFCILTVKLSFSQQPELVLPVGHTEYINSSKISPDGKNVITVGFDKKILLWDTNTGSMLKELKAEKHTERVAYNFSGTRILQTPDIGSFVSMITLWDNLGNVINQLAHQEEIKTAQFSNDGKIIITQSLSEIKIWNGQSGELIKNITENSLNFSLAISNDGSKIACGNSGKATVFETINATKLFELPHDDIISAISFSNDGKKIITGSFNGTAKIWNAENGSQLHKLDIGETAKNVHFNNSGSLAITVPLNKSSIKLWDTRNGKPIKSLTDSGKDPRFVRLSPNGEFILATQDDEGAFLYKISDGTKITLSGLYGGISDAAFTIDSKRLIITTFRSNPQIYDTSNGKIIYTIQEPDYGSKDIEMANNGSYFVLSGFDKVAYCYRVAPFEQISKLLGHTESVKTLKFNDRADALITYKFEVNGTPQFWDFEKGTLLLSQLYDKEMYLLFCSPSLNLVASRSNSYRGETSIWDVSSGTLKSTLDNKLSSAIIQIVFSSDDKKVITADTDEKIHIWNTDNGKLIKELPQFHTKSVHLMSLSSDDKTLITAEFDGKIAVWDIPYGIQKNTIQGIKGNIDDVEIIDNKTIVISQGDKISFYDIEGKLISSTSSDRFGARYLMNPDHNKAVIFSINGKNIFIWDIIADKLIAKLPQSREIHSVFVSPDWKFIISRPAVYDGFSIWDSTTGNLLHKFDDYRVNEFLFTKYETQLLTRSFSYNKNGDANQIKLWDLTDGKVIQTYTAENNITAMDYDEELKIIIGGTSNGSVYVWDFSNGKLINTMSGHQEKINTIKFGKTKNTIITASEDNTLKTWNYKTGKLISTFFCVDNKDYFTQTPEGYFSSSQGAATKIYYTTPELKVISFEQLDVKYNRPDKVLSAIGNTNTELINSYKKAYEKRLKKLGINPDSFTDGYSLPNADFIDRDQIEFEQTNEILKLHIKGNDSLYKLDRYNVWVNEVPIYGQKGISLKDKNSNLLDTTISLKLSQGENKIETSITNINGTESYRMPLNVKYVPTQPVKEKTYFIGIGIDQFADTNRNLKFCVKDIRDLARKLNEKYGTDIIIDTLFNENVTLDNVKNLKKKLLTTNENDKVIISYSGHGLLSKDYDYFLSTYSVNFDDPTLNGLPYDDLENLMDNIPARKKLMLIDACHSGEVDKDDLIRLKEVSDSTLAKGSIPVAYKQNEKHLGLINSFELMQSLFVNVGKNTGATIISAAAGTEFALELNELKNGVFTYSILEAMQKNKTMKISELKNIVSKRVEELTKGLQKPTSRGETIAVDWNIW
ncbi:caspase family protein [Yeosuana sp.]|uniref:caspase family protein n=1 Tax=Yeosuana sp. TaxID=2529388 RepID=UPI004049F923